MRRNRSIKDQLEAAFGRIERIDESEFELRADFSRYLCVLVSGYLEQSIRNATAAYVENRAHPSVANFVIRATSRLTNLDADKIKDHLLKFEPSWQSVLDVLLADEAKDAINSVVALRNSIAHGQPADVTAVRVIRYYKQIARVISELENLLQTNHSV